ncbi:serine/threonine protein kinase [Priestia filamentosa]|uniref:serine/threonine protein kinase n=1 Tax=Priestia filamentosa TaxID=1402861 RepID=UPI00058910EE
MDLINTELIYNIELKSTHPHEPIQVIKKPDNWNCIGTGNYAAVFLRSEEDEFVVKVYARGKETIEEEAKVYKKLGIHAAFPFLIHKGPNYLVLKRIRGITLYNAIMQGVKIPPKVIEDINKALKYAKKRGLNPVDVHGKNVMMYEGRGYVVDVSDFLKEEADTKWTDIAKAYYKIYMRTLYKHPIPVPNFVLNLIRRSYRKYKNIETFILNKKSGEHR